MAVVLLVRPTGSARADKRAADVLYVSPASGELVGKAFGFEWEAGDSYMRLKYAVAGALDSQATFQSFEKTSTAMVNSWVGRTTTPENLKALTKDFIDTIQSMVPSAKDVQVTAGSTRDSIAVSFSAAVKKGVPQ